MNRLFKGVASLVTALTMVFGLAACSSEAIDMSKVTAVIDVRTPAEFAEGHLQGAINIDVQGAAFTDRVQQLDIEGTYVIYCRSGNRSTVAIEQMTDLGFKRLTNGGSVSNASAITGMAIVQ